MRFHPRSGQLRWRPDTPLSDELWRVTAGDQCATFHGQPGGEWDVLRSTPLKVRQRLTGAGFFALHGWQPDRFADIIIDAGVQTDDPIAWYVRMAVRALDERRAADSYARHRALAHAEGHASYFEYRNELSRQRGFRSYWHERRFMGWD